MGLPPLLGGPSADPRAASLTRIHCWNITTSVFGLIWRSLQESSSHVFQTVIGQQNQHSVSSVLQVSKITFADPTTDWRSVHHRHDTAGPGETGAGPEPCSTSRACWKQVEIRDFWDRTTDQAALSRSLQMGASSRNPFTPTRNRGNKTVNRNKKTNRKTCHYRDFTVKGNQRKN